MGYMPTIGGLEKLQEFLASNGFPLPNFYMDVKGGGMLGAKPGDDIERKQISFADAKRIYRAETEVVDVRLANEDGSHLIQFSDPINYGPFTAINAIENGMAVVIELNQQDVELKRFIDSVRPTVLNIARWGKPKPSFVDRLKFRWRPRSYAQTVFS